MTIRESYRQAIEKAFNAAESLTEPRDKAMAYASIAQALSGLISQNELSAVEDVPKAEVVKESDKPNVPVDDKPKKQMITREDLKRKPQEPKSEWEPTSAEWDEESEKNLSKELDYIQVKIEEYGEESINEAVTEFSSGTIKEWSNLNPLNIRAFTAYLEALEADAESEKMEMPY